jgi:hypothetical protein
VRRVDAAKLDRWGPPAVVLAWLAGAALSRAAGIWLGLGGTAIVLATSLVLVDLHRLRPLCVAARAAILRGLLVGASMTLATYALYPLMIQLSPTLADDVAGLYARLRTSGPGWRALWLLPIVLGEEIVWRGFVQGALQCRHGARAGVLLAAALYALAHIPVGSPLLVVVAFACGLVWSALRATTSSLLAPLIAHLLWDVVVLLLFPLVSRSGT